MRFRGESGQIMIMAIILIPVLLLMFTTVVSMGLSVTGSDTTVQEGLAEATRAAVMQVNQESLAMGHPRVDPGQALTAFQTILGQDLGVDPNTMQPLPGSPLHSAPSWVLLVYNGDSSYGEPSAYEYVFDGSLSSGQISASGMPQTFGVDPMSITPEGGGSIQTTLKMSGAVAVLTTTVESPLGTRISPVRYAAAKIVCEGGCSY